MISFDQFWTLFGYITPFQAALVTSLLLFYLVYLFLRQNELPPGPIGLPFIGYWPFLDSETCHIQMRNQSLKYGDVLSFTVFGKLFVQLSSIKAVREAHVTKGDCFEGRYEKSYGLITDLFRKGLIIIDGEPWKVLRKFFLMKLKEFGMSTVKENTSGLIQDALQETLDELHLSKGQPIAITDLATDKCMSNIRTILFNDQGISKEEMQKINDEFIVLSGGMNSKMLILMGNFARYFVFPFMPYYWTMKKCQNRIDKMLFDVITRQKRNYDELHITNLVDCYFKEKNDRQKKGDPTAEYFTDRALVSSLGQFITDGVMTVGLFIGTFLLKLSEFPEEQEKIYNEIIDVVGPERLPTMEDKNKLPYTNAFMLEVMRCSDFFPFFPAMECSKDTVVQGMKIPKGAITVINFYAAQRNPNTFDDPDTFNPERYLSSPDKPKPESPILFGMGKRSCIGEGFTMFQAFLFFTTLVKNFRFEVPESDKGIAIRFCMQEKPKVCAVPRFKK